MKEKNKTKQIPAILELTFQWFGVTDDINKTVQQLLHFSLSLSRLCVFLVLSESTPRPPLFLTCGG